MTSPDPPDRGPHADRCRRCQGVSQLEAKRKKLEKSNEFVICRIHRSTGYGRSGRAVSGVDRPPQPSRPPRETPSVRSGGRHAVTGAAGSASQQLPTQHYHRPRRKRVGHPPDESQDLECHLGWRRRPAVALPHKFQVQRSFRIHLPPYGPWASSSGLPAGPGQPDGDPGVAGSRTAGTGPAGPVPDRPWGTGGEVRPTGPHRHDGARAAGPVGGRARSPADPLRGLNAAAFGGRKRAPLDRRGGHLPTGDRSRDGRSGADRGVPRAAVRVDRLRRTN